MLLDIPVEQGLRHKLYETMVTAIYSREFDPGDSFLDLGANIGHHTWQMANEVGPNGRGYAIEPVPDFAKRVQNVLAHKKIDWVELHNVAASDYVGECSFFVQTNHIGWSSMFSDHAFPGDAPEAAQEITVDVQRLDDILELSNSGRLSVIKVDVENAEFAALRGARETIAAHRPTIIFENNPLAAAKFGEYKVSEFFTFFTDLGYQLWSFHGERIDTADEWSKCESVYYCASPHGWQAGEDLVSHYALDEVVANFVG